MQATDAPHGAERRFCHDLAQSVPWKDARLSSWQTATEHYNIQNKLNILFDRSAKVKHDLRSKLNGRRRRPHAQC